VAGVLGVKVGIVGGTAAGVFDTGSVKGTAAILEVAV
jgi:hypothetical protein